MPNAQSEPFQLKLKVLMDRSMKLGTDGSNIEERDLTIRFPRRQIVMDRNQNANNSVPIGGKFYCGIFVHDGPPADQPPTMKYTVKTVIRD